MELKAPLTVPATGVVVEAQVRGATGELCCGCAGCCARIHPPLQPPRSCLCMACLRVSPSLSPSLPPPSLCLTLNALLSLLLLLLHR